MALLQHMLARFALWAVRFVRLEEPGARAAPWQLILRAYLHGLHPAFRPLALLTASTEGPWLGGRGLPPDVVRVVGALGALPPAVDVGGEPLVPGEWCAALPLWGNPLLPAGPLPAGRRPGLERRHPALVACPLLLTL